MMRRSVLVLLVLSPLASGPAWSETALAPAASPFGWTGAYVGLHAGATWGGSMAAHGGNPGALFATNTPPLPASSPVGGEGRVGGAQWGINYQLDSVVVGLESDLALANRSKSAGMGGVMSDGRAFTYTARQHLASLGALRARGGITLMPRLLIFGTAGLAYGHVEAATTFDITSTPARAYRGLRADTRVGWTAGVGGEYAFANAWSAKLEYLYYDLGRAGVVGFPSPSNQGVQTHSRFEMAGHLVRVGVNHRLDGIGPGRDNSTAPAAPDQERPIHDFEFEASQRYWYSIGNTKKNLYSTSSLQQRTTLVSRLSFGGIDAHSAESFARLGHRSGFFVKGKLGRGAANRGTLIDEDFSSFLFPYSATAHSLQGGTLAYGSIDIGRSFLRGAGYRFGAFAGYHYQRETLNAFGCTQTAASSTCAGSLTISTAVLGISQDNKWQAVRLGLEGQIALSDRLTLSGEAAWLPYAWLYGQDFHWLRIGTSDGSFDGSLPENGTGGRGFQLEAMVNYQVSSNFSIGAGLRYWRIELPNAVAHFEAVVIPAGSSQAKLEQWSTERYGGFLQASYKL